MWDQQDEFDVRFRFKVRIHLPQLENRFNLFVGRATEEEYLTNEIDNPRSAPDFFREDVDEDWVAGLGINPARDREDRLDFRAGVKLQTPFEAFVNATYRFQHAFNDLNQVLFRQTLFWEREDEFGSTTRLEFYRKLGSHFLLRWNNNGTVSGGTDGVKWWSGLTLYQDLSLRRALHYDTFIRGEPEAPVEIANYGVQLTFRQFFFRKREWLVGELRADLTWPQDDPEETREAVLGFLAGIEIHFGGKFQR